MERSLGDDSRRSPTSALLQRGQLQSHIDQGLQDHLGAHLLLGQVWLVAVSVETDRGAGAAGSADADDNARTVREQEANPLPGTKKRTLIINTFDGLTYSGNQ